MKTAVSIPDELFQRANELARRLRVSRSRLFALALTSFLAKHDDGEITERLDEVYGDEASALEAALQELQARSLCDRG